MFIYNIRVKQIMNIIPKYQPKVSESEQLSATDHKFCEMSSCDRIGMILSDAC
jgi:hypothetical protein